MLISGLSWVGVVPRFLFPLWILGERDGCVLPGGKFSLDLIDVDIGGSR